MQFENYRLGSVPPPFEKMDKEERKGVLQRFTKANLKLNIPLELPQLVGLLNQFIQSSLKQVDVTFKDWKGLRALIEEFSISDTKASSNGQPFDIQQFVQVKMAHQNQFSCFLYFLERKYQQTVSIVFFQLIVEQIVDLAKASLLREK